MAIRRVSNSARSMAGAYRGVAQKNRAGAKATAKKATVARGAEGPKKSMPRTTRKLRRSSTEIPLKKKKK